MSTWVFDMLFILGERRAPQLPAGAEGQPWTWPDAWLEKHKHLASVKFIKVILTQPVYRDIVQYFN